jgi:1-phosphofructokinase family hexose kinase
MILCICPTTTIERNWIIPGFSLGGFYRVEEEILLASGKGINTARVIKNLGQEVICSGFVGNSNGNLFDKLFEQEEIAGYWVRISHETRQSITVYDPRSNTDATSFCPQGPPITNTDWKNFVQLISDLMLHVNHICISGNIPPGINKTQFSSLLKYFDQSNKKVWLDISGPLLETGIKEKPFAVKVNNKEISDLVEQPVNSIHDAIRIAQDLRQQYDIKYMMITLGRIGAVCSCENGDYVIHSNKFDHIVSSIGCGDSFLGGFLAMYQQGATLMDCLSSASAAASANTQKLGAGLFHQKDYLYALTRANIERINN